MEKIQNKINKLCNETKMKMAQKEGEASVLLIEFAEKYNEIWNNNNG